VTPLLGSRPQRTAAILVFGLLGGLGFLPLFGGPGYEQSLASGLVVPSAAAIATAIELSASADAAPLACVARGLASGALLAGVAYATALVHGLRAGMCDFWGGTVFFFLTAGFGALVGGTWGAVVAEGCRGRERRGLRCVLLAIAGPLLGVAVSVARFYGSPMIFAYDPFFGYFSGTLYDTVVDVRPELWTYRAGSSATLVGSVLVASVLLRTARGKLSLCRLRGDPSAAARLLTGLASFAVSAAVTADGSALGHWQSASTIASALGGHTSGRRCEIVHPDSLLAERAALLARDCEQQLAAVEQRLGAHLRERLRVYVFADAKDKRRLMGAAETSIAKPWRREVYIQLSGYPHPVLGHEIAHVVAGSFARRPFLVAGGWWPNPGLIEGIAVAASPDDEELTDAQWARAMLDLGILPRMRELFSMSFLGESAAKSYTVAGAFVAWMLDRSGAEVVRSWCSGASIEALTSRSWVALEDEFRAWLRTLAMPPEAAAYARSKFDRPSVWARKCPHVVDALDRAADTCRDEHRFDRAAALYRGALARDPKDWHARFARARMEQSYGDEDQGRAELARIDGDADAPQTWRDRAQEALADDDLARGRDALAAEVYRRLAERTLDEDVARTLEVKARSADDPRARGAIIELLVGEPGRPTEPWLGALSLGAWAEETHDPVAQYLAGKNLAQHDAWALAEPWLDRALEGVLSPRIGRELLRQRAICACVLSDVAALARVEAAIQGAGSPFASGTGGRREWVLRLIARCRAAPDGP
jgi:hypothetical protein